MNGWRVTGTMSSSNGHAFGLRHDTMTPGLYVSAANTLRLVLTGYTGTGGDPTVTVTTGGNLDVAIQLDCDAPVGSSEATVRYFVAGVEVGSRTATYQSNDLFPTGSPFYMPRWRPDTCGTHLNSANRGIYHFYRRNGATVTGAAMTRWDNDAASVGATAANEKQFAVRNPVGGNPIRLPDGLEYILRPNAQGEPFNAATRCRLGLWTRTSPAEAWSPVSDDGSLTSSTTNYGVAYHHAHVYPDEQHRIYWWSERSDDGGLTWGGWPTNPSWDYIARRRPTWSWLWPRLQDPGMRVRYHCDDNAEAVYALPLTTSTKAAALGETAVAAGVRAGGDTTNLPYPLLFVDGGGWETGFFCNGRFKSWRTKDPFGRSWSPDLDLALTSDCNLHAVNGAAGYDGRQVAVGYHWEDETFRVYTRSGVGFGWDDPVDVAASATVAAPYVTQRVDGVWEVGWCLDATWTRYTATDPAGTWTVVP